jgi:tetratricopeptide (TPR) repeat protein
MSTMISILNRIPGVHSDHEKYCSAGNLLNKAGKYSEAMEEFKHALASDTPGAEALFGMGYSCLKLGRNEEALVWFSRLYDLNGPSVLIHYYMGVAFSGCKRYEEAVEEFDKVIALDPRLDTAYTNKAFCLIMNGDAGKGAKCMEDLERVHGSYLSHPGHFARGHH